MRVRFAPSPTGVLHIGGARTALYNWLLARGSGGQFVLRIEDTDRERSTPENVEQILDALRWLELDWDEGPISQWERRDRHTEAVEQLLESGHAYEDEGAVRFRVPDEGEISFHDVVLGDVTTPYSAIQDFVIRRSDGSPLYNLAVAVDDRDMGITHVVRGQDHVSNTPRQVMLLRGARRGAAGVRAHPAAARPGREEAVEAPRRGVGPGGARRRLSPGGGPQLHRPARLGLRREHRVHDHRRAGRALLARARLEEPGGVRRAEAALDERPLPARAAARGAPPPPRGVLRPRDIPSRSSRSRREKMQTLADFWPLAGPLIEAPSEYDDKAWQQWGRSPHLRCGARRARQRARPGTRRAIEARAARTSSTSRASSPRRSSSRFAWP